METLSRVRGIALPLLRANIDTDQIIPVVEMTRATEFFNNYERWGAGLFAYWRYVDVDARKPDLDFILNKAPWRRASILLAGRNFGCGSSREGAAMALRGYGFRAVIAPSFAGIFYGSGDPEWRHGIAGRSILDWVTGAAFAFGVRQAENLAVEIQGLARGQMPIEIAFFRQKPDPAFDGHVAGRLAEHGQLAAGGEQEAQDQLDGGDPPRTVGA